MKYLRLMRIHHYIKNLLIFAALACSGKIFELNRFYVGLLGFICFSFISSAVYIVNDIRDIDNDRLHPIKCNRPLASGDVSIRAAWILFSILLIASVLLSILIDNVFATCLILLYAVLNLLYSIGLKNYPILDISILVSGFIIRVIYGAIITDIKISDWLYLTVISIAFFFAMGKRRNELRNLGTETRKVLKEYPMGFLDKGMTMCLTLANVFYALWSVDKTTEAFYDNNLLIFTVPIVLLITLKYSLDIEGDSDGDPVEVLVHDKILMMLCIIYFAVMFTILYII